MLEPAACPDMATHKVRQASALLLLQLSKGQVRARFALFAFCLGLALPSALVLPRLAQLNATGQQHTIRDFNARSIRVKKRVKTKSKRLQALDEEEAEEEEEVEEGTRSMVCAR